VHVCEPAKKETPENMTLISRDQMPPRTPYEAELRERLERAAVQADLYQRIAALQNAVVEAARAVVSLAREEQISKSDLKALQAALDTLDRESGKILLESMPTELREALTGPSAFEEGLKAQEGPLFGGTGSGRKDGG
jgi:hypothetical protein